MAAGRTLANGLKTAGITWVDVVGPGSEELGIAARRQMSEAGIILD